MPPKAHAILSASSSHRWLNCPPSARLCETYEDKGSDYAAEGTDAHNLCEYKLRTALGMEATDPTEHLTWYNEEMLDCANGYAAFVESFEALPDTLTEFKLENWLSLVDYATVYSTDDIRFTFKHGQEVQA